MSVLPVLEGHRERGEKGWVKNAIIIRFVLWPCKFSWYSLDDYSGAAKKLNQSGINSWTHAWHDFATTLGHDLSSWLNNFFVQWYYNLPLKILIHCVTDWPSSKNALSRICPKYQDLSSHCSHFSHIFSILHRFLLDDSKQFGLSTLMATFASAKKERAIAKISKTYQRFSKTLLTSRLALQISCRKSHGLFKLADLYWFECFSVDLTGLNAFQSLKALWFEGIWHFWNCWQTKQGNFLP